MRLAQLDRAFGYGPKGRGFESSNARRLKKAAEDKTSAVFLFESGGLEPGFGLHFAPVVAKRAPPAPGNLGELLLSRLESRVMLILLLIAVTAQWEYNVA